MFKQNTFNGGTANATITAANSASSGDAMTVGGNPIYTTTGASGNRGPLVCALRQGGDVVRFDPAAISGREIWVRMYVNIPALDTVAPRTFVNVNNAGVANGTIWVSTSGSLLFRDNPNATLGTTSSTIPLNAWWRVELYLNVNTTTTNGIWEMRYYASPDSTIPTEVLSGANANLQPTAPPNRVSFTSMGNYPVFYVDDVAVSDLGWIGPNPRAFRGWGIPL